MRSLTILLNLQSILSTKGRITCQAALRNLRKMHLRNSMFQPKLK